MASRLWNAFRKALGALAFAVVAVAALPASPGQAACQNTLDFSGAAVNDTRVLDVSTCSIDIRWGLYRDQGDDALNFFPVSGDALFTTAPDAAVITLPTGAQLRFTPLSVLPFMDQSLSSPTVVVDTYTVTLLSTGSGANSTATLYYATNVLAQVADNVTPIPPNTAYPIAVTFSASAPDIAVSASTGGAVTDGGSVAVGNRVTGTPVTVTFIVTNGGTADLTLAKATAASPSNVTIGNITDPASTVVTPGNSTTFQVTFTPAASGAFSVNLSFVNNDSGKNPFNFTITGTGVPPAPAIVSLSPNTGPATGGTVVTINGANFTGATGVSFGGTAAASFSVVSANQITATSPAGVAGAVNVTVTTPGGQARMWRPTISPTSCPRPSSLWPRLPPARSRRWAGRSASRSPPARKPGAGRPRAS